MGGGSNAPSIDGQSLRSSTFTFLKGGHKRAMSYQYGNHCVTNSNKATEHDCSTAGNLGLDFPPNYHSACSDGSGVAIKVGAFTGAGDSFGSQLTSRGSSSTINNVHNTCNAAIVVSPDAAVGVAKENNLLSDNVDGAAKKAAAHDITPVCSLPPYSDIKGLLLQDSHEPGGADTSEQKAKLSFMSSKAIRNELKKTFLAFIFQQIAQLIMIWTVVKSNDRMELESPVLPDIILSRVPVVKKAGQWSEILLFLLFVTFIVVILFHKQRFLVLRRVLAVTGICLLIRSFCVWATVLPRSLNSMECAPKSRNSQEVIHRVFIMYVTSGLSIFGGHMCGNYFFSGHTCLMTIIHAAFYQYTPDLISPVKKVTTLLCITIAVLILLAHNHYTLDVLGAYYVASRVWMFYHFLAHNPQYRFSSQLNFCWSWLVNIFEDGSEGPVKNEFQSISEIYLMICQQTEAASHMHHRSKSRSNQKLQVV